MDILRHDDVMELLKTRLKEEGVTMTRFALNHGINTANISEFMRGMQKPQRALLMALGLKRKVVYVKINEPD